MPLSVSLSNIAKFNNFISIINSNKDLKNTSIENYFKNIPSELLKKIIYRQKLILLLNDDKYLSFFNDDLRDFIVKKAKEENYFIKSIYNLLQYIHNELSISGIRYINLKGITLSLELYKKINKRCVRDLDIFIDVSDLDRTLKLLDRIGFKKINGFFPNNINGKIGKYCLWIGDQLPLVSKYNKNYIIIDLHWSLSSISNKLPPFDECYSKIKYVNYEGYDFPILDNYHNFLYFCFNAAKDGWSTYSHFLDIDKLSYKLSNSEIEDLLKNNIVNSTSYLTYFLTKNKFLNPISLEVNRKRKLEKLLINNTLHAINNKFNNKKDLLFYKLLLLNSSRLINNPMDLIKLIFRFALPPSSFSNLNLNNDNNFLQALKVQIFRLFSLFRK